MLQDHALLFPEQQIYNYQVTTQKAINPKSKQIARNLITERKVMETIKFAVPEPSVAAATLRLLRRSGNTSATSIQAMGPIAEWRSR